MKPEASSDLYIISSSPHTHSGESVTRIMLDVVIALMPAFAMSLWLFQWQALRLTGVCVATCLLTEWLCRRAMRRASSLSDGSAVITGLLLAFNLPPALPTWMAVAPARRNSMASSAVEMPPMPITGMVTAEATCHTIRRAMGLMAGPESPPMMLASLGLR